MSRRDVTRQGESPQPSLEWRRLPWSPAADGRRLGDLGFFGVALAYLLIRTPGLENYLGNPDHGYQLSLGAMVLEGYFPFVDFFVHHGPLPSLVSAFGLLSTGSLLGETVTCATGYALAIGLACVLSRRHAGAVPAWALLILSLLLLPRFYKWYYPLFGMAVLYALHRCFFASVGGSTTVHPSRIDRRLIAAGIAAGIGGLFRTELTLVFLVLGLVVVTLEARRRHDLRQAVGWNGRFLLGLLLPFVAWFAALILVAGPRAVRDYLAGSFSGTRDTVAFWRLAPPRLDWTDLLSPGSATAALLFLVLPAITIGGLVVGLQLAHRSDAGQDRSSGALLFAVSLLALGISPQAYYRPDTQHLLQVLPVSLLGAILLGSVAWRTTAAFELKARVAGRAGVLVAGAVLLMLLIGLRSAGGIDLTNASGLASRYRLLAAAPQALPSPDAFPAGSQARAVARLAEEVERLTAEGDAILVLGYAPQLYVFSGRPMSGVLNLYTPMGFFVAPEWQRRNMSHLLDRPPALTVAPAGSVVASGDGSLAALYPGPIAHVRDHASGPSSSPVAGWELWRMERPRAWASVP